jgi:hypothetical protein
MRRSTLLLGAAAVAAVTLAAAGVSAGARKPPPFAQTGNYRPVAGMQLRDSTRLADNFVGDQQMTYDPNQDCGAADRSTCALGNRYQSDLGLKWVRIAGGGLDWQYVERGPGRYATDAAVDELFNRWVAQKVKIIVSLGVGDGASRPDPTRLADPREVERYKAYVRYMVSHFKGRIAYYEIWNEPDNVGAFLPVERYVDLIKQVIPVIRAADPTAKIVVGATGGSGVPNMPGYGSYSNYQMNVTYLKTVIASGVAPLVDGISWHPFYGVRADDPWYRGYPRLVDELRQLARSEGFRGRFFAEEMKWVTAIDHEDPWQQPASLPVATKYLLRTIVMHRGLGFVTVVGIPQKSVLGHPLPIQAINNLLAGATPATVAARVETKAKPLRSYGFTRPNGDRMLALWTDGLPRDRDVGTPATIMFLRRAERTATVLDPLHAQQQKLAATSRNGSLVVRGLLVRDYPIFVRLSR